MYARLSEWIREAAPGVFVYLCMESRIVWQDAMGEAPRDTPHLSDRMDGRVRTPDAG